MEDFVREAVRQGFSAYGFSSHAPLPFPTKWTILREDVGAYLAEARRLRDAYAGQIEIYAGLEIDYLDEEHNPASEYFRNLPLDYRIGSVHLLPAEDGEIVDIDTNPEVFAENMKNRFGGDIRRVVTMYYDRLMRMIELGGIDFVGHADKLSYNASCFRVGILDEPWYRNKVRDYFAWIAQRGLMVEVNTKTYARNGFFYPNRSNFALLKSFGIPVVVNSDAHQPALIDSGRPEALQALEEAGIDHVRELIGGRWLDVAIG